MSPLHIYEDNSVVVILTSQSPLVPTFDRLCQKAFTIDTLHNVVRATNDKIADLMAAWDAACDSTYVSLYFMGIAYLNC